MELEDVGPGTYESISDMVTARWIDYYQSLADAIRTGTVSVGLKGKPLPDDTQMEWQVLL